MRHRRRIRFEYEVVVVVGSIVIVYDVAVVVAVVEIPSTSNLFSNIFSLFTSTLKTRIL